MKTNRDVKLQKGTIEKTLNSLMSWGQLRLKSAERVVSYKHAIEAYSTCPWVIPSTKADKFASK